RRIAKLAAAEQMIFADAIKSAFARGDIGPAVVLDAMPQLARSTLPQIAFALSGNIVWMREHLATDATRPALDAYAVQLYAPRWAELVWQHKAGESDADSRLRQRIVALLAIDMRDPATRRELDAMGRRALGLD